MSEQNDKIVTRYDRRMERRKEQKRKEQQEKKIIRIISIVCLVLVAAVILSFPIRNYLAINGTYIKVNGEKVTRVEYDYYFGLSKQNYQNQYGSYLSYFGIDLDGDLTKQMYSDTMTLKDYFDQGTVEMLKQNKAMLAQAKKEGFTYDVSEEYKEFTDNLERVAASAGVSQREYLKSMAGDYATLPRLSKYIKDTLYITKYYAEKEKEFTPTDAEIETYYQENKDSYDRFDYRMTTVNAELPEKPTDLADAEPVYDTDGKYTPSEAEVAKAMEDAKKKADLELLTIASKGEEHTGESSSSINSYLREWMLDESRKAGDTTVVENTTGNCYYAAIFENRSLNTDNTVDARIVLTVSGEGQAVLDEWNNGEKSESAFIRLCNQKSMDTSVEDGLYTGIGRDDLNEDVTAWLFDGARNAGDVTMISDENYDYVLYYIGTDDPQYQISIRNILMLKGMNEYVQSLTDQVTVEDPKKNLHYLIVQEEAATQASEEAQSSNKADSEASDGATGQ